MRTLHYHVVDVFTERQFGGNQLAVYVDAEGISGETMQAITREMNFSETSFVLPPEDPANNYKVRIFTPGSELPMAGHPTVGTSFILARQDMVKLDANPTNIRLEEGVGTIPVSIELQDGSPGMIRMTQPLPAFGPRFEDVQTVADMLSLPVDAIRTDVPVEVVSCGVPFLFVPVKDLQSMKRARVRLDVVERALQGLRTHELFLFAPEVEHEGSTVHSRMFAPGLGVSEDPATGAASGPLGSYLVRYGLVSVGATTHIVSEQGIEMGRPSFLHIEIDQEEGYITGVRVGGRCVYVAEGYLHLQE